MEYQSISRKRLQQAKRAFTTRRVPLGRMRTLITGDIRPQSGQLLLATVLELGKHRRIERIDGRRAWMFPGDEILVSFGNRYAPDQFEALVSEDMGLCDLVAAGGIAGREINRHERMLPPTQIMPVGLVGDDGGRPLNLYDFRHRVVRQKKLNRVILIVGTAMNSGKTFTAASLIRGLKLAGHSVAGVKATGTGSGGDLWKMKDMGADVVMDFTDGGFASTYKISADDIETAVMDLIHQASKRRCDYSVVEIADGLHHEETATLLRSAQLRSTVGGVVFAASDSVGARAGYQALDAMGYPVIGISGMITRSPLMVREVGMVNCPVVSPYELQVGALVPEITGLPRERESAPTSRPSPLPLAPSRTTAVDFSLPAESELWQRGAGDLGLFGFTDQYEETA